jgi:hypothetical protein
VFPRPVGLCCKKILISLSLANLMNRCFLQLWRDDEGREVAQHRLFQSTNGFRELKIW